MINELFFFSKIIILTRKTVSYKINRPCEGVKIMVTLHL